MFVKDIIEHSIWLPSADYGKYDPKVSIFLPAYAKAKSGLFEKALDSILNQTFKEFELIIVDDASTDGTKEIIDAYMQIDKRISCIRHPQNIGLPAISEYEAYMKSSGHYIMFAFDDFIFEPNAIHELYMAATENNYDCCYGQAKLYLPGSIEAYRVLGVQPVFGNSAINFTANSSIILKRSVLETVGLYDPHILMARECDWDLLQRISIHYSLQKVEVMVGAEYGLTQNNSLGNAYQDTRVFSRFYKALNRNQQLLPKNFANKNIIESQLVFGNRAQAYLEDLVAFYQSKFWFKNIRPTNNSVTKKIAFFSTEPRNYHLCFERINDSDNYKIQQIMFNPTILQDLYFLMSYDAVIVDRNLQYAAQIIPLLKQLQISCYYYIDDNFLVLKNEYPEFSWYSMENVTNTLKSVDAVLTSTEALRAFFLREKIHSKIFCYPPILNNALLPSVSDEYFPVVNEIKRINIAVIGEVFCRESFCEYVVPALNKLMECGEQIHLTVSKNLLQDIAFNGTFSVDEVDVLADHNQYIHQLKHKKIDIIIQTYGKSSNAIYKTPSVLLNALYLNANIIVFGDPAFEGLGEAEGVMSINQGIDSIVDAIKYLSIPAHATPLKIKLSAYCHTAFNFDKNIKLLDLLTRNTRVVNTVSYEQRMQVLIYNIAILAKSPLIETVIEPEAVTEAIDEQGLVDELVVDELVVDELVVDELVDEPAESVFEEYKSIQHCFEHLIKGIRNKEEIPQFKTMLSTLKYKPNANGLNLKKGPLLNKKNFREYRLKNVNETLSEIMIACAGHSGTSDGLIGIELVLPNNTIALHCTKSLQEIDFLAPIVFHFPEIFVPVKAMLLLRVFVRDTQVPISVYELRTRKFMSTIKKKRQLFCSIS